MSSERTRKPRVGLTLRLTESGSYPEPRDAISHDWILCLDRWDIVPVLVPNALSSPQKYAEDACLDLLILTGGDSFGETPLRDDTEITLMKWAADTQMPVLGVCRGMQIMASVAGGNLQEVDGHVAKIHEIRVLDCLRHIYGSTCEVNSFHNLGIRSDQIGAGYQLAAEDGNGYAEAMVHSELPAVGIMWHPERAGGQPGDRVLVESLIEAGAFWKDVSE